MKTFYLGLVFKPEDFVKYCLKSKKTNLFKKRGGGKKYY